ncbi:Nardilysin [Orbilia brochopaga]|nr:Nardilysin [Drechslerella brochopaga]
MAATRQALSRLALPRAGLTRSILKPSRSARAFATPATPAPATWTPNRTETTTLSNGFTIATESNPGQQTATVGVWIDAGSRSENDANNGTAHFLEHLAFKGTTNRTQNQLELEIENMGGHLNAYTSRENTVYYAKAFKNDVGKSVEILSDILQHSRLDEAAIEREREVILREQEEVDKQLEEVVFDHLHATAFQGQALGRTILGPKENILSIQRDDLADYIKKNYTSDRMVLVGAGGVNHNELVKLAEKHFGGLKPSPVPTVFGTPRSDTPDFIGSEVRMRDDEYPTAHIAIAVEGVSWKDDNYFTALVAQAIVGNWDRTMGNASFLGSKLASYVHENHLANSFMSFSTSYSDTGLWGIYLVTDKLTEIDDLVHFSLREWTRLATSVDESEVERAKAQLKASLLLSLDGTTAIAEDIGRQLITTGRRMTPAEVERVVGAITPRDVMKFAEKHIWDQDIAVSCFGSVEGLFDYQRIRNEYVYSLRFYD